MGYKIDLTGKTNLAAMSHWNMNCAKQVRLFFGEKSQWVAATTHLPGYSLPGLGIEFSWSSV